jgi:hypothetical protein
MQLKKIIVTGLVAGTLVTAGATGAFAKDGGRNGGSGRGSATTVAGSQTTATTAGGSTASVPTRDDDEANEANESHGSKGKDKAAGSTSTTVNTTGTTKAKGKESDADEKNEHALNCSRADQLVAKINTHLAKLNAVQVKLAVAIAEATTAGDTELVAKIQKRIDRTSAKSTKLDAKLVALQARITAECSTTTPVTTTAP